MNYGVITQGDYICVYDSDKHKQVFRCHQFNDLVDWMREHSGQYEFIKLIIKIDSNYIYE